jgi:ESS family glutamate:Na+ symporter
MGKIPPSILIGSLINLVLSIIGVDSTKLPSSILIIRDNLLIIFFICVGLSLSLGVVRPVARPVLRVLCAAVVLIVGQNFGGMVIARVFDAPLESGVLLGSVSFVGGFGSVVAWGGVLDVVGISRATSIGMMGALLGTVLGAVIAGPFGELLAGGSVVKSDKTGAREVAVRADGRACGLLYQLRVAFSARLGAWIVVAASVASAYLMGELLQIALSYSPIILPRFLTGMIGAVFIVLVLPERVKVVGRSLTATLEVFALNIFLLLTFVSLDYRALIGIGPQVLATAAFQVVFTVLVAWLMVFMPISRDTKCGNCPSEQRSEAAATAAAVVGFGLSSLSVAMAVLSGMKDDSGRSRQTIAVTGAGLVDTLNALGIGVCFWVLGVI